MSEPLATHGLPLMPPKADGYHGPAQPGSPFRLADPCAEPLPQPTRSLIVWQDRISGERRITTWSEVDAATGEVIAEGCGESGEEVSRT